MRHITHKGTRELLRSSRSVTHAKTDHDGVLRMKSFKRMVLLRCEVLPYGRRRLRELASAGYDVGVLTRRIVLEKLLQVGTGQQCLNFVHDGYRQGLSFNLTDSLNVLKVLGEEGSLDAARAYYTSSVRPQVIGTLEARFLAHPVKYLRKKNLHTHARALLDIFVDMPPPDLIVQSIALCTSYHEALPLLSPAAPTSARAALISLCYRNPADFGCAEQVYRQTKEVDDKVISQMARIYGRSGVYANIDEILGVSRMCLNPAEHQEVVLSVLRGLGDLGSAEGVRIAEELVSNEQVSPLVVSFLQDVYRGAGSKEGIIEVEERFCMKRDLPRHFNVLFKSFEAGRPVSAEELLGIMRVTAKTLCPFKAWEHYVSGVRTLTTPPSQTLYATALMVLSSCIAAHRDEGTPPMKGPILPLVSEVFSVYGAATRQYPRMTKVFEVGFVSALVSAGAVHDLYNWAKKQPTLGTRVEAEMVRLKYQRELLL
eukprot:TRINITY_DN10630_c0_g1_i1.p1 TRINITY_DN10630_c0_g1~~TRINITY_DN10630_c0_g1_i1.p1  ORF type:complete len:484 (+),score=74.31 TRINITY_DN10630_c0_g1_i1:51-1502(+)